jgi:putative phosphoserine phosphatase / 1-acylglycerol-3-phosphate O-acyltransferase
MTTVRSAIFWSFLIVWTVLLLPVLTLASLLTFGLGRFRLMNVAMPWWAWPPLWIAGVRVEVNGGEFLSGRAERILVFNHTSLLDMFVVCALNAPGSCPLGKKEFAKIPVIGTAWWALGGKLVDRGNSPRARRTLQKLGADLRKHGLTAVIAPEGTRSRTGALQPFKMGAFHLAMDLGGIPMVPVVIHNAWNLCHPDDWRIRSGKVTMVVYPPIDTKGWTKENLRAQADALHDWYAERIVEGPSR